MTRYDTLMARIAAGERILIDGATGTEVERRGVPQLDDAWNGGAALSHPDILRQVHLDYIAAGAEIVIANTFATHRFALMDAGVGDAFEAYNRRGVELAVEARERSGADAVLVAGGISYWRWAPGWPPPERLEQDAADQAAIMAEAGADVLLLEMMVHVDRLIPTLQGALTAGLPVWAGLSCKRDAAGDPILYRGDPLSEAVAAVKGQVDLINIMHTEVENVDAALDRLSADWDGPVGVYAHSGGYRDDKWIFDDTISPHGYSACAKGWLDRGVSVIGGCCGIRTEHITALAPLVGAPTGGAA